MTLKLSSLFSDGLVLQRNSKVRIWGHSFPKKEVVVYFLDYVRTTMTDENGAWEVLYENLTAGGPYIIKIESQGEIISINNVCVGDVWICGGQSNMELKMERVKHGYPEEIENANCDYIRSFEVPKEYNFHGPVKDINGGFWKSVNIRTISEFSAVGYFFAKKLYEKYNVPIGLLETAVGGTPIHSWMSKEMLKTFPDLLSVADQCASDEFVNNQIAAYEKFHEKYFMELNQMDKGIIEKWYLPEFYDGHWEERELLKPWDDEMNETGTIWFRKKIYIPHDFKGKAATLFLGTIVDADEVYLNGNLVGKTEYGYLPREYEIKELKEGENLIAIRIFNHFGYGEFTQNKSYMLVCDGEAIDLSGNWKFNRGVKHEPLIEETFFEFKPTGLYNGVIAPLQLFAIKGAIWYQGESDTSSFLGYKDKFESMVYGWRKLWDLGDFPFLFVQLAYYDNALKDNWDLLRKEQQNCLSIPNTGMVTAIDAGEYNDLHPINKQIIGDRLARLAQRVGYGEKLQPSPYEIVAYKE